MLNPDLDPEALARAFAKRKRLVVRDVLQPQAAETIHDCLARRTPWSLAFNEGNRAHVLTPEQLKAASPQQKAQLAQGVMARARNEFQFLYNTSLMLENYVANATPGHLLMDVFEIINGPPMLDFVRRVTGVPELVKADAQATLYAPGHFLTIHDDRDEPKGRRIAYVLQFAKNWRADWGGALEFLDADGNIEEGFVPRFNAMALFAVPQLHHVSYVPPYAPVGRFAITGWFMDR